MLHFSTYVFNKSQVSWILEEFSVTRFLSIIVTGSEALDNIEFYQSP